MVTEVQLFEVSVRCEREKKTILELKCPNEKCSNISPCVVTWIKVLAAYLPGFECFKYRCALVKKMHLKFECSRVQIQVRKAAI